MTFHAVQAEKNHPLIEWYHQAVAEFVPTKKKKITRVGTEHIFQAV
jgi:hypothetical protein